MQTTAPSGEHACDPLADPDPEPVEPAALALATCEVSSAVENSSAVDVATSVSAFEDRAGVVTVTNPEVAAAVTVGAPLLEPEVRGTTSTVAVEVDVIIVPELFSVLEEARTGEVEVVEAVEALEAATSEDVRNTTRDEKRQNTQQRRNRRR
jgi:UTP-glucose-1-phosphate uridylyltransferase